MINISIFINIFKLLFKIKFYFNLHNYLDLSKRDRKRDSKQR